MDYKKYRTVSLKHYVQVNLVVTRYTEYLNTMIISNEKQKQKKTMFQKLIIQTWLN